MYNPIAFDRQASGRVWGGRQMSVSLLVFYVGPDQTMPVLSGLAAAAGFLLIFWHRVLAVLRKLRGSFRRPAAGERTPPPSPGTPGS